MWRITLSSLDRVLSCYPLWCRATTRRQFCRCSFQRLRGFLDNSAYPCEVLVVDDGSTDRTLDLLADWCKADERIKVLSLSRNFGHQYAATAGIDYATGDAIVLIDADLQDPLEVIHQMVEQYRAGYDVVCGQRVARPEKVYLRNLPPGYSIVACGFFLKTLPPDVGDFRLMSRRCVDNLRSMREMHRFLRGMVAWVGFPQTCVRYERQPRVAGTTKYPLRKMISLAWTAAVSFSALPLRISFFGAGIMTFVAIEEAVRSLIEHFAGKTVPGWTSLMVVLCLSNAALLVAVGILGEYVGRIYEEGKGRPLYLVADSWNVPKDVSGEVSTEMYKAASEKSYTPGEVGHEGRVGVPG